MYFTKCVDCGDLLEVSFVGQEAHPHCRPGEIYQLTSDWCEAAQRDDVVEANRLQAEIDKHDRVPELGASALWYAQIGWPVFPLVPGEKRPATKNGFRDATTDPDQIREWWSKDSYNLGTPTGLQFDVIDVDGPIGIRSLAELGESALPDVHAKVSSPRGLHFYVKSTGDGNRVGVRPGLDYRGAGGLIVLPPSRMKDKRWTWLIPPSPEITTKG